MQARHEMVLTETHETGAEEWWCPSCGRRFLVQWAPNFDRVVLDPGEESASHVGGRGGMTIGRVAVDVAPAEPADGDWQEWLKGHGIDWDGPAA